MLPIAAQRVSGPQAIRLRTELLCRNHLQVLNVAITNYMADWDGRLPALGDPAKFAKQMRMYRAPGGDVMCPFTDKMYHLNAWLAGKRLEDIPNKGSLVLIWSQTNSGYMVLDGNGRTRKVDGGVFAGMRRASHI
jgi:hypothetical protein